jgi:hypothetical protein
MAEAIAEIHRIAGGRNDILARRNNARILVGLTHNPGRA